MRPGAARRSPLSHGGGGLAIPAAGRRAARTASTSVAALPLAGGRAPTRMNAGRLRGGPRFDAWCRTDPATLTQRQADPRAQRAITARWAADPDPVATNAVRYASAGGGCQPRNSSPSTSPGKTRRRRRLRPPYPHRPVPHHHRYRRLQPDRGRRPPRLARLIPSALATPTATKAASWARTRPALGRWDSGGRRPAPWTRRLAVTFDPAVPRSAVVGGPSGRNPGVPGDVQPGMRRWLCMAVLLVASVAGCARTGGETTGEGSTSPVVFLPGPAQLVAALRFDGGFVPPGWLAIRAPRLAVYSDGRAVADADRALTLTSQELSDLVGMLRSDLAGQPATASPRADGQAVADAATTVLVNASRKLTPCGSGKIDPGGVGSVAVGAVFLGQQLAALAGAVGVTGEGEDLGVVDQPVDHRCGHDVVGEGLTPAPEGQVRGDHDRALLVAGRDELEEQVRRVLVERDVPNFIDNDQLVAADLLQLGLQPHGVVRADGRG